MSGLCLLRKKKKKSFFISLVERDRVKLWWVNGRRGRLRTGRSKREKDTIRILLINSKIYWLHWNRLVVWKRKSRCSRCRVSWRGVISLYSLGMYGCRVKRIGWRSEAWSRGWMSRCQQRWRRRRCESASSNCQSGWDYRGIITDRYRWRHMFQWSSFFDVRRRDRVNSWTHYCRQRMRRRRFR